MSTTTTLDIRPALADDELNELFAASWPGHVTTSFAPVLARSLLWVAARRAGRLVGYVNVAGDGGVHAFVLDTTVHPDERRQGLGPPRLQTPAAAAGAPGAPGGPVDHQAARAP
ncbi:GNAT family N-acetyltransferase, partial [Streptomyces sp. NPDC059096]|uniref:GNAT family N-acetyltransferase n=1 Tax=Streptomyces sp. NPDC059096 TaxID=3346727 RepID=UPI00369C2D0D